MSDLKSRKMYLRMDADLWGEQYNFLMPPSYDGYYAPVEKTVSKMFVAFRLCETVHTEMTWSDNEDSTALTSPLSGFVSFDIGMAYESTWVSLRTKRWLRVCLQARRAITSV